MRTADGLMYQCEAAQVHMLLCKNADASAVTTYKAITAACADLCARTPPVLSIGIATCVREWPGLPVPAA